MPRKIFSHFGKFVICILPKAPVLKQEDEIRLPTPKPQIASDIADINSFHPSFGHVQNSKVTLNKPSSST